MRTLNQFTAAPWRNNYVTYRRFLLDAFLREFSPEMLGVVIDLGGKRSQKRGTFQPPEQQADMWLYINLDIQTQPNIFADVTKTPLKANIADVIICTEVLEHLPDPQCCVNEISRLLHVGGVAFVTTPFFYPVHGDPQDYQRFTEDGLRYLFRNFETVDVYRMGGYAGVMGLMLELGLPGVEENSLSHKILRWMLKWISRWLCRYDVAQFGRENKVWSAFTTGYFVRAIR